MLQKKLNNIQKKSLKERFLLVIGILFLLSYLVLGLLIIFMKNLPIQLQYNYRVAFGVLLIVYSFFRFMRIINDSKD
jgi:cytochrome c biogenesis protein CcdA